MVLYLIVIVLITLLFGFVRSVFSFFRRNNSVVYKEDNDWRTSKGALELFSSVGKVLECPVCREMARSPVRMCHRSHVTCVSCAEQLTVCCVCQNPFLPQEPTCVNNLLDILPRQCRYKTEGCGEVLTLGENRGHEQFCRFRKGDNDLANSTTAMTLVSSLRRVLECPVCLEMVSAPVTMCQSGHVACTACVRHLNSCSICRQPLLHRESNCFKNLLEILPRQCRYKRDGCKVVFVPGDGSHEQFCGLRPIPCRKHPCGVSITVCDMKQHYEKYHKDSNLYKSLQETVNFPNFCLERTSLWYLPVCSLGDHFFYLKIFNDAKDKSMKISFEGFFVGRPVFDFYVRVKFENGNIINQCTIKAITMKDKTCAETWDTVEGEYCMRVTHDVLVRFLDKKRKLCFHLTFLQL